MPSSSPERQFYDHSSGTEVTKENGVFDVPEWRAKFGFSDSGNLNVEIPPLVSTNNSTTATLGAGGVFTGVADSVNGYGIIYISVYSDQDSAIDGLAIEQSTDGINWDHCDEYSIPAGRGKNFSINPHALFMRVIYTNGATPQTEFRLQVILKATGRPSAHRIQDPISDDDDAELVKSVITGLKDNGDFDNAALTNSGNFKVAVQEYGDTPSIDAFDRLRVSENFTIFDSKQLHDKQPLFWDEELGGSATSVHVPADAATKMTVTASASDYAIRQTRQRFNYQPGKSQLVFFTFYSPQVAGLTKRMGYFSGVIGDSMTPENGIFFSCDGDLSWNVAKDGTTVETATQANWAIDKLDGTGPSELTLDMAATQIGVLDFEWLGVGRIRVGFVINGLIRYVHYFNHSNDSAFDSVYMSTPNLPMRYDIQSDGTAAGSLDHICSSVISEGGIEKTGILRSVENGNTLVSGYNSIGTKYALVGIRLKSDYIDVSIIPEEVQTVIGTNDSFKWELHLNPTVNGTFTYNDLDLSSVQFAQGTGANDITTDGLVIGRGGGSTQTRTSGAELQTALRIGSSIAGDRDELVLCIVPLSANLSAWATLNFRELL